VSDDLQLLRDALGPRYLLGAEVGRGGMATVYRARDIKHGRDVAVKVLDQYVATAIGLERFQREISIAAALQHPNIVPLYDSGGAGRVLYYIMPLVEGESLRQRIKREVQLAFPDALAITRDVAAALTYAHAAGVVHRDIKPENILLSGGKAMVADFGIARALTSAGDEALTELGGVLGTAAYMSPEQAGGSEYVDGRADIYALGCVLFEMLAGEPPFSGRTPQALLARHVSERPPSLRVVRPTAAIELQQAVEKALAKVPADRFTTATSFSDALDSAQLASISGTVRLQVSRPVPRRAIAIAAVVAVGAVAAAMLFDRAPTPDPNRVVVYPLSAPGSAGDAVGEQVALMIESVLEHTEPLRWLDGQVLLDPGRAADARLPGAEARRIARRSGARYYLDGAVVRDRDSLTVIVRLHDAVGDSLVRQESATGAAALTTAPQLALRAVAVILPRLLPPNGRVDVSYLADRNPAAIADWLHGERAYARSRYHDALQHMSRALERDSAMGVAALKGAQAANYLQDYEAARRLIDISLRHDHQLPSHHRALARGLRFHLAGFADSAVTALNLARSIDTTWSEPWMLLAETYYHLMPQGGALDSLAERALEVALRLQPGFAPSLIHLVEFAARRGDARRARDLLRRIALAAPDSGWTFQADLTVRCAVDGPDAIDWRAAVRHSSDRVVDVARILGGGARHVECARRALEAVLEHDADTSAQHAIFRWSALKGLNYLTVMEGRHAAARALLDSATAHGVRAAVSLHIPNAAAGSLASEDPADSAIGTLSNMPISAMPSRRLRYLSLWTWHRGDTTRLDSVARRMRAIADSSGLGTDRLVHDGAVARLALRRGDTATALRTLRGMRTAGDPGLITWDLWESAASELLLLAELQLATGDPAGAIETAERFDSPRSQIHLLHLPASLRIRLRAAERLGRSSERAVYQERLRAIGRTDLLAEALPPAS
jgi:tRNA A-37 threonylcarbamoyl transferase component Bud32/tetratricopeptide (TPR) repeat protein